MKIKLTALLLLLALLLAGCAKEAPAPSAEPTQPASLTEVEVIVTPEPTPTPKPVAPEVRALEPANADAWRERQRRECMEGRLLIPSANINVALFSGGTIPAGDYDLDKMIELMRQTVTDNEDSAILYNDEYNVIADHSNQAFATLSAVQVGDTAYILAGDRIVSLRCDLVTTGINTGHGITDADGQPLPASEDYVCYTCMEDWTHVRIVGFHAVDEDYYRTEDFAEPEPTAEPESAATPTPAPEPTPTPAAEPTPVPDAGQAAPPAYEEPQRPRDEFLTDLPFGAGISDNDVGFLG